MFGVCIGLSLRLWENGKLNNQIENDNGRETFDSWNSNSFICLFIGIVFDTGSGYRPKCDLVGIGSRPDC